MALISHERVIHISLPDNNIIIMYISSFYRMFNEFICQMNEAKKYFLNQTTFRRKLE